MSGRQLALASDMNPLQHICSQHAASHNDWRQHESCSSCCACVGLKHRLHLALAGSRWYYNTETPWNQGKQLQAWAQPAISPIQLSCNELTKSLPWRLWAWAKPCQLLASPGAALAAAAKQRSDWLGCLMRDRAAPSCSSISVSCSTPKFQNYCLCTGGAHNQALQRLIQLQQHLRILQHQKNSELLPVHWQSTQSGTAETPPAEAASQFLQHHDDL